MYGEIAVLGEIANLVTEMNGPFLAPEINLQYIEIPPHHSIIFLVFYHIYINIGGSGDIVKCHNNIKHLPITGKHQNDLNSIVGRIPMMI